MTYTPEQHAEAVAWVKERLARHEKMVGRDFKERLIALLRYLLGRLEAHAPDEVKTKTLPELSHICISERRYWPCTEVVAALDAVAEMRQA